MEPPESASKRVQAQLTSLERLHIHLFGGFELLQNGRPLPRTRSRTENWLLSLLILRTHQAVERTWLAGTLWPDTSPEQGLNNLRRSLSNLRQVFGEESYRLFSPTASTITFDMAGVFCDMTAFDAAVAHGDIASLRQAETWYRGPLLEASDANWLVSERARRQEQYLEILKVLADDCIEKGDGIGAARLLRRTLEADPLSEESYRRLMQILGQQRDYAAVERLFRQLRRHLRNELNLEPSADTIALHRDLLKQSRTSSVLRPETGSSPPAHRRLPIPLTSLVGRTRDREAICAALVSTRLVTLTGPGGVGKTRLAIEVAERLLETFQQAVWFVPLVETTDSRRIADVILESLCVVRNGRLPLEQVVDALSRQPALLILDNFEQLAAEGAALVQTLLTRLPQLTLLVTSQQLLGLFEEQEFMVPALDTPSGEEAAERLNMYDSVRLFVDRAQSAQPQFQIDNSNAAAVAGLCHLLEGLPLAIELAAARTLLMTPEQILTQLEKRFRFLVSRKGNVTERQRTLHAAIDWSYHLLSPDLQAFFAQLSVFRGGWTVEAAETTCEATSARNMLAQLRGYSLMLTEENESDTRFRMLETLREYAQEQLSAEARVYVQKRHAAYFTTLAEEAATDRKGPKQAAWLHCLEREHDNLRAVLDWCRTRPECAETGLRLCAALRPFWLMRGYLSEGRAHLEWALRQVGTPTNGELRAKALLGAGDLAWYQGDYASARTLYQEGATLYRTLGDKEGVANALCGLGSVAREQLDYTTAFAFFEASLGLFRELDLPGGIALSLGHLGEIASKQGNHAIARPLTEEGLALYRAIGDRHGTILLLGFLGAVAAEQGDFETAWAVHTEALMHHKAHEDRWGIAYMLERFADLALLQEQPARGARLGGAAQALREILAVPIPPSDRPHFDRLIIQARAALGEDDFNSAWQEGRAMEWRDAADYVLQTSDK